MDKKSCSVQKFPELSHDFGNELESFVANSTIA